MAEVTFLGLGPVNNPPDSLTPPNETAQLVPGIVAVPSGQLVGIVATYYPENVVQGVSNAAPEDTARSLFTAVAPAPDSIAPEESPVLAGPLTSIAPFGNITMGFQPGTAQTWLVNIGNAAEQGMLPGISPGMNSPLQTDSRDVVTLKRGMRVVFADEPNVNSALRGQSFDIINFETSVDLGSTGVIRDVLTLRTAMPVNNGTRDSFRIMGRQLTRLTPRLEIILG